MKAHVHGLKHYCCFSFVSGSFKSDPFQVWMYFSPYFSVLPFKGTFLLFRTPPPRLSLFILVVWVPPNHAAISNILNIFSLTVLNHKFCSKYEVFAAMKHFPNRSVTGVSFRPDCKQIFEMTCIVQLIGIKLGLIWSRQAERKLMKRYQKCKTRASSDSCSSSL